MDTNEFLDSKIDWQPIGEHAYDGSKLNYGIGYDPFDMGSLSKSSIAIFKRNSDGVVEVSKELVDFRLPRKLKKSVKKECVLKQMSKSDLQFNFEVYKISKY